MPKVTRQHLQDYNGYVIEVSGANLQPRSRTRRLYVNGKAFQYKRGDGLSYGNALRHAKVYIDQLIIQSKQIKHDQ